jgi:hypothetical protein
MNYRLGFCPTRIQWPQRGAGRVGEAIFPGIVDAGAVG